MDEHAPIAPPGEKPEARAVSHIGLFASGGPLDPAWRVTLNFHPDRLTREGLSVLSSLGRDGVYFSQFVTGTSNGGLTARPGGDRWRWESRIFGGAYDTALPHERPVYGALDFRRSGVGGAPRFGSSYFRLASATLGRTTFCYPDSSAGPARFGVVDRADALVAAAEADHRDALDDYVEAQVHGPVRIADDIEALVLDACYRGTSVEAEACRLPCPLEWHPGYRLPVRVLREHPDFRGQEYVDLGARIARDGVLDAGLIGEAARSGRYDPQAVKKVWHYLARFGAP
ncbi:DUF3626 domain-containing protein [Streptomyces sp. 8L]|uniref:DUF3626 domain-containing protein n=1 Tax=Streptomyces sp. 8L TaxID=2877242 RepID=UPI001CD33B20|nr:DUF3626 domain-containing protein [Streptomyces sp. 8L]MCA1220958.1 DUF3626 domain-containing protein [Streptomyces sp. 8L]